MSSPHAPRTGAALTRAVWVTAAAAVIGLLMALPATAVGVDGVDIRVNLPTGENDRPVLELEPEDNDVEIIIRNTVDEPRTVRVYGVAAAPAQDAGSFDLGGPGSAPWFGLGDERFDLGEREEITRVATVNPRQVPEGATHLAVVLETGTDSTVVTRAARVVELGDHEPLGLPLGLVILAGLLIAAATGAHLAERRARHAEGTSSATRSASPST